MLRIYSPFYMKNNMTSFVKFANSHSVTQKGSMFTSHLFIQIFAI